MDAVHFHLLLNHIPLFGLIFGGIIFIAGWMMKKNTLVHAGLLTIVICSFITYAVVLTGNDAEEIVEHASGVSHDQIEEHEEIGNKVNYFAMGLGLISLITLSINVRKRKPAILGRWVVVILVVLTLIGLTITAYHGGLIRHPELEF